MNCFDCNFATKISIIKSKVKSHKVKSDACLYFDFGTLRLLTLRSINDGNNYN